MLVKGFLGDEWFIARQQQAISWTDIDLSSVRHIGTYLNGIIQNANIPIKRKILLLLSIHID